MKLSELLSKPIKLKGGGLLNLKGFNKRIIDKEIYSKNNNNESNNNVDEFDKLFHLKYPKDSGNASYNEYYNPSNPNDLGAIPIPKTNLADFVPDGVDIPIFDPNDDDFFIILVGIFEATSENSANVSIFGNDFNNLINFTIEIITDEDTGESSISVDNFSYNSNEDYSFIESCIIDSISKMDLEVIKKIIGEPQISEQQEI